jgi:hypothetical protein
MNCFSGNWSSKLACASFALLVGCASAPIRDTDPVAIRQGETKKVGADGLELTVRWLSEDSGSVDKDGWIQFTGSIDAKKGKDSHAIEGNAALKPGDPIWMRLYDYWFDLIDIRRDSGNRLEAVFRVPGHGLKHPAYNLQAGQAYLARNKAKTGVTTTDTGLQYEVIKLGAGKRPTSDDTVEATYLCKHIDGSVCAKPEQNSPAVPTSYTFLVSSLVKGLIEGIPLMPEGSSYRFTLPSTLAYGDQTADGIGQNETLIMEIELIHILPHQ